jgi:hypothetical protein
VKRLDQFLFVLAVLTLGEFLNFTFPAIPS